MSDKNIFLVALLSCSALAYPNVLQAETVSAKTSWAVSRVASTSQGSYCTMAQKYSDDTVLTFAQNTAEEYSLAIDFKDGQFKGTDKQNVALSPQGGTPQKYSVKPKSERTMVINIGKDTTLINQLTKTGNLSVDLGGRSLEFVLKEFGVGQSEIENCMNGLKSEGTNTKGLKEEDLIKRQVAVIRTPEISDSQPTAEGLLAAMPMPSADITPAVSPQKEAEFIKVNTPSKPVAAPAPQDNREILSLREENARLTRSISEQRQMFENQNSSKESAALNEIRTKLDMAKSENESLKLQLNEQKSLADKSEALANKSQKSSQELDALKAENETLKNQIKIATETKRDSSLEGDKELQGLQLENKDLKQEIADLKTSLQKASQNKPSAATDDEIIKVRNDLRQLTGQLDVLKTENEGLKNQIATLQKNTEGSQLKVAGGNWDLEQSTRRYQESQREIVRLGALLQAQDSKCTKEKKDIEYMLFDPAIADKAQIAMLNSLEDKVKEKDEKLKLAEGQIAAAKIQVSTEKDNEIAQLKKTAIQTKLDLAEKLKRANQSQDEVITSLKIELDQKNQQISKAQTDADQHKLTEATLVTKQQTLDSLKAELAQKNQQLTEAQAKIQGAEKTSLSLTSKDSELNTLKADLLKKNQQLSEIQIKMQDAEKVNLSLTLKDTELNALKADLAQKNQQLTETQVKLQQVSEKVDTKQNEDQTTTMANLQLQVQQANQQILILQKQVADSKIIPVQVASAASFVDTTPTNFKSMDDMSLLLKKAGVSVRGSLQKIQGGDTPTYRAYSWKTDSLFGSVEMKKVSDSSQFYSAINQYLDRAKARCKGEFAAIPSSTGSTAMSNNAKAYEIACVGGASASSASVLFSYGDTIVTTIAHEGRADAMDLAIDARDKVASQF